MYGQNKLHQVHSLRDFITQTYVLHKRKEIPLFRSDQTLSVPDFTDGKFSEKVHENDNFSNEQKQNSVKT